MSSPAFEKVDTQRANISTTATSDLEDGRAETRSQTGPLKERVRHALSRYDDMVLATDRIPIGYNMLASIFSWLLLAGFLVLPGTFSYLDINPPSANNKSGVEIHGIRNMPMFIAAYTLCGISAIVLIWLWWRQRRNYVWLLRSIFVPGVYNGLSGLIMTFVNVYSIPKQGKVRVILTFKASSVSSLTTLVVVSATTLICSLLAAIYTLLKLRAANVLAEPYDYEREEEKEKMK